jgi:hypothetical protein
VSGFELASFDSAAGARMFKDKTTFEPVDVVLDAVVDAEDPMVGVVESLLVRRAAICASEDGASTSKASTTFDGATDVASVPDSIVESPEKSMVRLRTRPLADPTVAAL